MALAIKKSQESKNEIVNINESKQVPFAVVEAYKTIRTNLTFLLSNSKAKVFGITSPEAGEGKSTTSINMSVAFAQLGDKVLLIDADMRRSSIHKKLKIENNSGLSEILAGFKDYKETIVHINDTLDVITAGQVPPNPSELLGSDNFKAFIEEVGQKYSYVIIDTPPVDVVTDAWVVAPQTAGLVLVVKDRYTPTDAISRAIETAKFAEINILGAIMNGANPKSKGLYKNLKNYSYNKYKSYGYAYKSASEPQNQGNQKGYTAQK